MGSSIENPEFWEKVDNERLPTNLVMPFPVGRHPSQWCPMARPEQFRKHQNTFHREIRKMMKEGYLYVGPIAIPKDLKSKGREKVQEVLMFHAIQRAVQVLQGRPYTDSTFLRGLTGSNYLVDVVTFTQNSYEIKKRWHEDQMKIRAEFLRQFGDDVDTILENFDIEIKEVTTETGSDYSAMHGEKVCYYTWYAVFLKPKKKPVPEDAQVGTQNVVESFAEAWTDTQHAFEEIGINDIPNPPRIKVKPAEQHEEQIAIPVEQHVQQRH